MRIGVLSSHPIQYQVPLFRALAKIADLQVFYAHRQDAKGQAAAGYGVDFDWDVDLTSGYASRFLRNDAARPSVSHFFGCRSGEIAGLIRDGGFDGFIVSGWNLWVYWQAVLACRRFGVPVLARGDSHLGSPRSLAWSMAKRCLYPHLLGRLDGFLAVGARSDAYLRYYRVSPYRIFSAQHVIDCERFAAAQKNTRSDAATLRARLHIPESAAVVLFVGRLIPWKRLPDLIMALAQCQEQPTPTLLVVGDGPERERWQTLAVAQRVPVVFAGFVNQAALPSYYRLADLMVLPSDGNETWGLVVNEAIAAGVPVLVSDAVGCADELAIPGLTGGRFPVGDCRAMAVAMREILARGRASYADALAEKARWFSPDHAAAGIVSAVTTVKSRRVPT